MCTTMTTVKIAPRIPPTRRVYCALVWKVRMR
jgi:hypothetical protein